MDGNDHLPCPFCGHTLGPLSFGQTGYGPGKKLWHVSCYHCFALGPVGETLEDALRKCDTPSRQDAEEKT